MTTNSAEDSVKSLFLKVAESFDKCPELKYAAANARILAEPEKYSAAEIQPCPDIKRRPDRPPRRYMSMMNGLLWVAALCLQGERRLPGARPANCSERVTEQRRWSANQTAVGRAGDVER